MNITNAMRPVHPGEVLREELEVLEMSANSLAAALGVPGNRITAILNGQRGITADTALRLSRYLGTTAEFWLNLQKSYELRLAEREAGKQIEKLVVPRTEAA
jgi:addiction module HigA family antidote